MRKLLIIHEMRSMRNLLRRFLVSELNDVVVWDADSIDKAIHTLNAQEFDVVISANRMEKMDGAKLCNKTREFPKNNKTPFIIITSDKSEKSLASLRSKGITHYLISPFSSEVIAEKINAICNPRKFRAYTRVSIPNTKAIIAIGKNAVEAQIINFSPAGILCEFQYVQRYSTLITINKLKIIFPPEYEDLSVNLLKCKLSRLNVLSYTVENTPDGIRVVFIFVDVSQEDKKNLEQVVKKTQMDLDKVW